MAAAIPYTYIQCPCTRDTHHDGDREDRQDDEDFVDSSEERAEEDDDFDPHNPRANYSLYPIDHLLYCEICAQIRCQRCLVDEIVTWFCPNCLFEVPSSTVKSEGNRCTRSCFQCPICIAPLSLTGQAASNTLLGGADSSHWVLSCASCSWSSSEIGIQFDRPNGIYSQLSRIRNGGQVITPPKERALGKDATDRRPGERRSTLSKVAEHDTPESEVDEEEDTDPTPEARFANLRAFYQSQMSSHGSAERSAFTNDYSYASPNALSRIMNLYTSYPSPTPQKRMTQIREALNTSEGLHPIPDPASEAATILKLRSEGWAGTPSTEQRAAQPFPTCDIHSTSELRPSPYLLRTKRTKRCRTCKHIVVRPEAKVQTSRFRMKMLAASYIPTFSIRPLPTPSAPAAATGATQLLQPGTTHQFVLTVRNPLYERVRVTLAAAAKTPGRVAHGVTLLCPQFEVGASREAYADMLDEALGGGEAKAGTGEGEAGKVYERARNAVGVVVEVVPGVEEGFRDARSEVGDDEEEEEEALEIPVRVRVEWEAEGGEEKDGGEGAKVKRELGFWVVLGVGKVRRE